MDLFGPFFLGGVVFLTVYIAFWVWVIRWVLRIGPRTRQGKQQIELLEKVSSQLDEIGKTFRKNADAGTFNQEVEAFLEPLKE